jgi:hypothetical protein
VTPKFVYCPGLQQAKCKGDPAILPTGSTLAAGLCLYWLLVGVDLPREERGMAV